MADAETPRFECPTCRKTYKLKPELAGKKVQCKCGEKIIAPKLASRERVATIAASSTGPTNPVRPRSSSKPRPESSPMSDLFDEDDEPVAPLAGGKTPRAAAEPGPVTAHVGGDGDEDGWKWWYYVLAGVGIGCFSVYQLIEGESLIKFGGRGNGPLGGFIIAALAIAVGFWSKPKKG